MNIRNVAVGYLPGSRWEATLAVCSSMVTLAILTTVFEATYLRRMLRRWYGVVSCAHLYRSPFIVAYSDYST